MPRRKRLNVMRKAGRFYFYRESGRYSDGSLDGTERLWVYSSHKKPRKAVPVSVFAADREHGWHNPPRISVLLGTYRLLHGPVATAHAIRDHILSS